MEIRWHPIIKVIDTFDRWAQTRPLTRAERRFLCLVNVTHPIRLICTLDNSIHTTDSRSTTISESTSTSDHHQHISPPSSRDHHPLSQSTVDSLRSCKSIDFDGRSSHLVFDSPARFSDNGQHRYSSLYQ